MKTKLLIIGIALLVTTTVEAQFSQILTHQSMEVFFLDSVGWSFGPNDIQKTTDYGDNWIFLAGNGTINGSVLHCEFIDENIGFVASGIGTLYKTTDGGLTWVDLNLGAPSPTAYSYKVDIAVENSNSMTVLFSDYSFVGKYLYQTTDQGLSWNLLNNPVDHIESIEVDQNSGALMTSGGANASQITINNGATWSSMNQSNIQDMVHSGNTTYVIDGPTTTALHKSTNLGLVWTQPGFHEPFFDFNYIDFGRKNQTLRAINNNTFFVYTGVQGTGSAAVWFSNDAGLTYDSLSFFSDSISSFFVTDSYIYIASAYDGGVWRAPITTSDDVWPGDTNSDGLASIVDILPIGIGYGSTGPIRTSASINWVAQPANNWGSNFVNGVDYKHADCDGDGTIDQNDLNAILLNYGLTHSKGEVNQSINQVDPNLLVEISVDTTGISSVITASIKLGDLSIPANDVYGVTFSLNYDPTLIDTTSVVVNYNNSWLGNISNASDLVSLDKNLPSSGRVDIGLTRTNQANNSGMGEVASVEIFTIDDLTGKQTLYETLALTLSNVKIISLDESIINVNLISDSTVVTDDPALGLEEVGFHNEFSFYPNPATDKVTFNLSQNLAHLKLTNVVGQQILNKQISNKESVSLSGIEKGIYIITISYQDGTEFSKKLILN